MTEETDYSKYLFYIQTIQSSEFRILIEALKEILTDATLEFHPEKDNEKGYIKLLAVDQTHTVLVHLKLEGAKFEKYVCGDGVNNNKITIGVSMLCLFKLIKTIA